MGTVASQEIKKDALKTAGHTGHRSEDWSLVHCLDQSQWKCSVAERWGFDFPVHWKKRHMRVHKWPWSKFTVTMRGLRSRKEESVCSFSCCVSETGREEKMSNWIKDMSVVGFHPRVLVVQVVLSKSVKLLAVDWQTGQLLGTYSFAYNREPCLQECFLSPDAAFMICRQDFLLRRRLHHAASLDANIRIIRIKDGLCQRQFVIQDFLAMNLLGSGISFDPRYPEGRLTVFSSTQQAALDDLPSSTRPYRLRVYDLNTRQTVAAAPSLTDKIIHHIEHSPDGRLVAALGVNVSLFLSCHIFLSCIDFYCADTLRRLHHLALFDEPVRMVDLPLFPAFSRNGSLLAQISGEHTHQMRIYQMAQHQHSLQDACRSAILHHTPRSDIDKLPLPPSLIEFLRFMR